MQGVTYFFQNVLKVRPKEFTRTALAFAYLFTTIGAFITARIAKSALFLEIPNYREQLPLTYMGIAITVSVVMTFYSRHERKLRRDITNTIALCIIIAITLFFRFALEMASGGGVVLQSARHEVYWGFFIWVEVLGTMLIVQFWSFIPEIFTSRQAKRIFAIIGGGGVLANIAFGLAIRWLVPLIGTDNLLFVIAGCLLCSCLFVQLLSRNARAELTAAKERAPSKKQTTSHPMASGNVFATNHVRLIAIVVVLTYFVSTLVDYQFNVIVGDSIAAKDARSAYFAAFFLYTGIIGGIIQFTLTARILEKFGVFFALLLLPVFMLMGTGTLIAAPFWMVTALWAVGITKGSENVLRYTINDSTLQLLYLPLPAHIRGRTKALIDGVLKPVSVGVAGFILALCVGQFDKIAGFGFGMSMDVVALSGLIGVGLVSWGLVLTALRSEYLKSLVQTLQKRRLNFSDANFEIGDEGTLTTLHKALASDNMGQVLHALELMPHVSRKGRKPLTAKVVTLLHHGATEVRVAALQYLTQVDDRRREQVRVLLSDASKEVRAAAVLAYCAVLREQAIERVHVMLTDCDHKVQAAAVAGLIRYGGLDGVLACADLLKYWFNSEDPVSRRYAAWVLGEIGVENFYQPLVPLLKDPSESVRLAAITAAGRLANPKLIEHLIGELERPRLSAAAVNALAAFGHRIVPTIGAVLGDLQLQSSIRVHAAKVLARLGEHDCVHVLRSHVLDEDPNVRAATTQALMAITASLPGIRLREDTVQRAITIEARRWFNNLVLDVDVHRGQHESLLQDALRHRRDMTQTQILHLLGLKYPRETIDLVAANLKSPQANSRANAVEVLDNLLNKDEKALLIPLIDDAPVAQKVQTAQALFSIQKATTNQRLCELLRGTDPWLQSCAAVEVAHHMIVQLKKDVYALLDSKDSVVRETAVYALSKIAKPKDMHPMVAHLINDPTPHVGRYTAFVCRHNLGDSPLADPLDLS